MVEFKAKADEIIKQRWGIEVEHFRATISYESQFYRIRVNKARGIGQIYGFPTVKGAWCNSKLKMAALQTAKLFSGNVSYVGIAADEPNRFHNLTETKRYPLVEAGWTEAMCREWSEANGLLSPIYTTATRGGCWFCHNQGVDQLRLLRKNYPEYWALMLKWDKDSPVSFKPDGHTVHDFDARFALEDEGIITPEDKWKWAYLADEPIQLKIQ